MRIPPIKLVSRGRVINEVMELITRNVRNSQMLQNDLVPGQGCGVGGQVFAIV
ncbi:hypothetical protein [Desulfosporosinus metallidurans]|uniref:N-methylhydantoinase B n=1 Tax=Desulfosporosinus metallidurans TaxID=1888891 RepID=A0A1Q8QMY6_9FIRM|nr:hypothetical protein [Desulfosporosinus metallidurans]OLN28687.1 N-methylhydantoinase B [Desulfosporosinus metallidurans]